MNSFRLWFAVSFGSGLWLGLPGYLWITEGWQAVEKTLTKFAMPVGAIWSLLLMFGLIAFVRKQKATRAYFLFAILLGTAGNHWIAGMLSRYAEDPFHGEAIRPAEPFAAVVLLGGATRVSANNEPELSWDGQRLFLAAQLYHAGKTNKIIATGGRPALQKHQHDHALQSKKLLVSVGIPESAISCLGGQNTKEEIDNLAEWMAKTDTASKNRQIGLIAKATHLSRAMLQAENRGLNLTPVPCLMSQRSKKSNPLNVIPDALALSRSSEALYELLARHAGH